MVTPELSLGQIVATPAALETLAQAGCPPTILLSRHASGDWGDISREDAAHNQAALSDGSRILSSYTIRDQSIWIITEARDATGKRPATTILLPEEY